MLRIPTGHRTMKFSILTLLALTTVSAYGTELPFLSKDLDPAKQDSKAQATLPDLVEPYLSTAPKDLDDGLQVGKLDLPGTDRAVQALLADDKAGKYEKLDSLLIWKDGKLIFEMYNRRGRVDGPHYAMSITKTLTSVTLARAIQKGLLTIEDLDKPVVSFMPEIDKSKIQQGVETITLRDALFMKSGLRFKDKKTILTFGQKHERQAYFQQLFQATAPITPESKQYKYAGTDPSMIMMIIDIKTGGEVQEFIRRELAEPLGLIYCWPDQSCGIPQCGAGSNFTSRSLIKLGSTVKQGGQYNGKQLLSADYVKLITDTTKGDGYFYYFHNRTKLNQNKRIDFISGNGAGGQYMSIYPELDVVVVATATKSNIKAPLQAFLEHLAPLFIEVKE
jgi:CubicO group peptidase (beta-lactamase class C family)